MSGFEIAHLRQCLRRSEARELRYRIIILVYQMLQRKIVGSISKDAEVVRLSSQFKAFPTFMYTIPDNTLPTRPYEGDADKYYQDFCIYFDDWFNNAEDFTFCEYLTKHYTV